MRMTSTLAALALTLSGVLAGACTKGAPAPAAVEPTKKTELVIPQAEQTAAMIQTEPAQISSEPDVLRVTGRIALADDRTWHVGVRTDGLVAQVDAGMGDYVKKDQVLARYHADEARDARAQYRSALAELSRAQAAAALAQRNADRMQSLLSLKAASAQQAEQARDDLQAADTNVQKSRIEVQRVRDVLEDDLHIPADPKPDDATADQIPITAPASGFVIEKNVTPGRAVQPSTDAFVIGDLSQVWMLASVRQENLAQLRVGQAATVTLRGLPGQAYVGKIMNLGQEADPATRAVQVRIVLTNTGGQLRPEMLATADIPAGSSASRLVIASDAVQQINGQDAVFVRVAPDRFVVRPVQVGDAVQGRSQVIEGLKAGEQVVTRGSFVLKSQLLRASMEE